MKFSVLKKELRESQRTLAIANSTIFKQSQHIEILNKQLDQQDFYLARKDEEFNVLKRMYRDDIINNYTEVKKTT